MVCKSRRSLRSGWLVSCTRCAKAKEAPPAHIKDRGMYSRLGGGLHARLQTKAQRALSLCKKSDVGNTQPGPNPAPHSSPDTKQDGGRVLENQLSWRWQQQEEKEDYNGVKWLHHRGSLSGELRGCAGKVVCCAVSAPWAPQPLLRERNTTVHTTVAHNHCVRSQHFTTHGTAQAIHTPAQLLLCSTAIPPGSVRPHYQMFARVAKLRVSQNLRGHHLDGQLSEGADLSSAVLSAFSRPLTYTWWLSSWHFLGGVCVLFDARLRLLGRML